MDVKSSFLNGVLKEEVYVAQPPSYEVQGQEDNECWFRKALYGPKQAQRAWYSRIDAYSMENGFEKCDGEPNLYIRESDSKLCIVVMYVDDLIFTGSDDFLVAKAVMMSEFEMTDLGFLRYCLGIEVKKKKIGTFIFQ